MILITAHIHPHFIETLQRKGYGYVYAPAISRDELLQQVENVTGLVVTTRLVIDKEVIDKAVKLQWIGRLGSGMELIDVEYARSKNIACESSPEGNRTAVAEQALGMLLSLMHRISSSNNEVRKGIWKRDENRGTELSGKVVGIVGFGNTGSTFAKLLQSLDVSVLAYDKYKHGFGNEFVKEASFEQLCRYADVISFHVPLTGETRHMADRRFFTSLGEKPWILNTSRGPVVHTADLLDALNNDLIRGVGLDVLENENINSYAAAEQQYFDDLNTRPNVLITPHIAGYSHESFFKMSKVLLEKLGI